MQPQIPGFARNKMAPRLARPLRLKFASLSGTASRLSLVGFVLLGAALSGLSVSCTSNPQNLSNEQLQQKAANATEKAKQDSKEALANARVAAANAESEVNAIASGVREGIRTKPGAPAEGSRVNVNTASEDDLAALPGITPSKAKQIVRHRPYASVHQLVSRGLLSQSELDKISSDITAR